MRVLNEKETDLISLAISEGIFKIQDLLETDFEVAHVHLTVHQQNRLNQIDNLLYTLFCEVVEENGVLQSEYDQ